MRAAAKVLLAAAGMPVSPRSAIRPTLEASAGWQDTMELKFGALSPYVRKVMVVAHEVGVADRLKLTPVKTREEPEKITPFNPLGKIPALSPTTARLLTTRR